MRIFDTASDGTLTKRVQAAKHIPVFTIADTLKGNNKTKGVKTEIPTIVEGLYKQIINGSDRAFQQFKDQYLKSYPREHYNTKFIPGFKWPNRTRDYLITRLAKPVYKSLGVFSVGTEEHPEYQIIKTAKK